MRKFIKKTIRYLKRNIFFTLRNTILYFTSEYSFDYRYGCRIYTPWFGKDFKKIYSLVQSKTYLCPERGYSLQKLSVYGAKLGGNIAECGTYQGGSAFLIAHAIKYFVGDRKLYLFDTFRGILPETMAPQDYNKQGDFSDVDFNMVKSLLGSFSFVEFRQGIIPDTFKGLEDLRFSFVHVDADSYSSTADICRFFYERMIAGGIMLFDEYGDSRYQHAERRAVDNFFIGKPEVVIPLNTGTAFVIINPLH